MLTAIAGLQGLNTQPVTIGNLDVAQGFTDYLLITVNAALINTRYLSLPSLKGLLSDDEIFSSITIGEFIDIHLLARVYRSHSVGAGDVAFPLEF